MSSYPPPPSPGLTPPQVSFQTQQHRTWEGFLPCTPARQPATLGMLWISWTCTGHLHSMCSAGLARLLCLQSSTHTHQRTALCMLCGHLCSLPRYLAGCSSDHPDGNPSQTGSVSDSTHSFWEEARLGKPRWVVDPQTQAVNESILVLPGEACTMENASQVMRK